MKTFLLKGLFLLTLFFTFTIEVNGQNDTNNSEQQKIEQRRAKLDELQDKFEARNALRKAEANAFALKNGISLKMELEDGGVAELQRIAEDGTPIYYRTFNSDAAESTRTDWLNTGGGLSLDLNGNGLIAHVWDGGHARITHQEYDGPGGTNRVTLMDTGTEGGTQLNFHAAHVTGTICAEGVVIFNAPYGTSKGMAWQTQVRGYMWNDDLAEAASQAGDGSGSGSFNNGYDMLISNHSYGYIAANIPDGWFGQYGQDAVDWDDLMYNSPYYLMVVAAGNDGEDNTSNADPLSGNVAYDKLSGHATAKNNMVVANGEDAVINPDGSLNSVVRNPGSSEGPTDDFRIKPDIMGNGTGLASTGETADDAYIALSGTSMASPNVAGSLLLLQEHYDDLNGVFMRAATLKGLALHTADDVAPVGPDAQTGWGLMNSKAAAEAISDSDTGLAIIDERTLTNGGSYSIEIESNGVDPLLASISWTDPAGTRNFGTNSSTAALVNDLDITITQGATTSSPWRLTGVNTNSTGDNTVDPFERVDITGASGIYTLTVTHKGTLSAAQDFTVIVTGASYYIECPGVTKTWNGTNWSPAGAPGSTDTVIIAGNYNTADDGDITACALTVNAGSTLIVNQNDFLSVANDITVNGTLNLFHTANVVQVDDDATVTNNGTINVFVNTPALDGRDFIILGSPMSSESRADVFTAALRVRNHLTGNFTPNGAVTAASNGAGVWVDEEGDDWPVYNGAITPGEGYMVMRDLTGPASPLNLNFNTGTLNNGVVTYTAGYNGSQNASPNIIANPYASAISATDFINTNSNVDAVYFWEHITTPSSGIPGPYGLDYTMEDISIFNLTGGTSAAGSDPGTTPNGTISSGQGFGVKVTSAGDITFNNSMRRTSGNTTLRSTDDDRIWLNVQTDRYELNSTALIGFLPEATNAIDHGYDAKRLATNVALYSHLVDGSDQFGIQALGTFQEDVKVPMGFATLVDERINYTISIEDIQGLHLGNATAYLIDSHTNTITNLSETNYTFESEKGIYDNRFTLQFTPELILGNTDVSLETIAIYPNPTQDILNIASPVSEVKQVTIYDVRGRVVKTKTVSGNNIVQVDLSELNNTIYFVEVTTESGTITKRVVKN